MCALGVDLAWPYVVHTNMPIVVRAMDSCFERNYASRRRVVWLAEEEEIEAGGAFRENTEIDPSWKHGRAQRRTGSEAHSQPGAGSRAPGKRVYAISIPNEAVCLEPSARVALLIAMTLTNAKFSCQPAIEKDEVARGETHPHDPPGKT
jgi:hypothetical protein